jgi:hypothetical protein
MRGTCARQVLLNSTQVERLMMAATIARKRGHEDESPSHIEQAVQIAKEGGVQRLLGDAEAERSSIRSIRDDFRETRLLPLLHVETHGITVDQPGGPHGLISSVDDCVLWPELMQELIPLHQLTQLRLFVTL